MKRHLILGAALAAFASAGAFAHPAANNDNQGGIESFAKQSDLIIRGRVVDIQYRTSRPTERDPKGIYHTFVTYAVEKVYYGRMERDRSKQPLLTLRFEGGTDGAGKVMSVNTQPVFSREQSDILFLDGGKVDDCPIVECVDGRFMIDRNRVYNGFGVPVVEAEKELVMGGKPRFDLNRMEMDRPDFDGLMEVPKFRASVEAALKRDMSIEDIRRDYEENASKKVYMMMLPERAENLDPEEGRVTPLRRFAGPMRLDQFERVIERVVGQLDEPKEVVQSLDPDKPFVAYRPDMGRAKFVDEPVRLPEEEAAELREMGDPDAREAKGDGTRRPSDPTFRPLIPEPQRRTLTPEQQKRFEQQQLQRQPVPQRVDPAPSDNTEGGNQ